MDDDDVPLLLSSGPAIPKEPLNPKADGVDFLLLEPQDAVNGAALLHYLSRREKRGGQQQPGNYHVCKAYKDECGWKPITESLGVVPRIGDYIHVFDVETRGEDMRQRILSLESQLQEEKARQKGPPILLSKKRMMEVCGEYFEAVKHVLKAIPREEADYKARYPSSVVDVCTIGNVKRPCLLWDGVGTGTMPLDKRFLDWQRPTDVTVVLAPSGSGKTRMLLEVGSRTLCLFFTGHKPSITGGLAAVSSADVSNAVKWVEERLVLFKQDNPEDVLTFATGALLITRLAILAFLRDLTPTQNRSRDWVFFQAEYPSVRDVFQQLLALLLETTADASIDFARSIMAMKDLIEELALKVGWGGLVILDESQSLLERLPNTFLASSGQRTNPVLIPLIGTISSFAAGPKFVSGTGASMVKVREKLNSGSMKPFNVHEVYSLGGFSGSNDLSEYMRRYIDISGLDMDRLGATYRGRRRWFVTALEHFMENVHPRGSETEFFMNFSERILTERGKSLGVARSLYEDAELFWSRVTDINLVDELLVRFYLGGEGYVVVAETSLSINLIHCGLAPVFDEEYRPKYDNVLGGYPCAGATAIVQEPLAVEALWRTRRDSVLGRAFDIHCKNASSIGSAFETYGFPALGDGLDGKILSKAVGCVKPVKEVYGRRFKVVRCSAPPGCLVKTVGADEVDFVARWARDVEMDSPQFPTYLHLGNVNKSQGGKLVGGPDGLFVLREVLSDEEQRRRSRSPRLLLVLVQFKTGENVSMPEALASLDLKRFCDTHNCPKLLEWAGSGYVQIVMTTPLKERRPTPAPGTARSFGVPPLQVMIHGRQAIGFVDEGVHETLRMRKKRKAVV